MIEETGEDNGGVLRDALVEFWESFYTKHTEGANIKVPIISNNMTEQKWVACGKILVMGMKQVGYFPMMLDPVFLKHVLLGKTYKPDPDYLVQQFLDFVPEYDKEVITSSLSSEDLSEDLVDVLASYQVQELPTKENLDKILQKAAHRILIQEPTFIVGCWTAIFSKDLTPLLKDGIDELYAALVPTTKKVLDLLDFGDVTQLSVAKTKTMNFLIRFIKGLKEEALHNFMRFVTGSNLVVVPKVTVAFVVEASQLQRAPCAHTCGCTLELPYSYLTFQEFRQEFTNVLESKVWVMDVV